MELPLRPPPPGVTSNFSNPVFLGLPVIVTAGFTLFLIVLFAIVRIYARIIILKKWRFEDYVFGLTCSLGIAMVAFSITIVRDHNGYHAWDIDRTTITKSSVVSLMSFWIALGPVFWLLKLNLFCFIYNIFKSVRWFKNCVLLGIVATGLLFSTYTIVITMSCGPESGSDTKAYLQGLNRTRCTGPTGLNAIVSMFTTAFNAVSNLYILLLPLPLLSTLRLPRLQMRGVYTLHATGALLCICSLLGAVYRVKSWQTTDLTGAQIPHTTVILLEISLSLAISCIPSAFIIYRFLTVPEIDDRTTLASPNKKLLSTMSSPQSESRTTWRKTHLSIEEMPFRQASLKAKVRPVHRSRMKALPTTPLPVNYNSKPSSPVMSMPNRPLERMLAPPSPTTPTSLRSMQLPIMLSPRARLYGEEIRSMQSMDLDFMLSPRTQMDQAYLRQ